MIPTNQSIMLLRYSSHIYNKPNKVVSMSSQWAENHSIY